MPELPGLLLTLKLASHFIQWFRQTFVILYGLRFSWYIVASFANYYKSFANIKISPSPLHSEAHMHSLEISYWVSRFRCSCAECTLTLNGRALGAIGEADSGGAGLTSEYCAGFWSGASVACAHIPHWKICSFIHHQCIGMYHLAYHVGLMPRQEITRRHYLGARLKNGHSNKLHDLW